MDPVRYRQLLRVVAPAAFLLAATVGVLLVRSAVTAPEPAATTVPATTTTAAKAAGTTTAPATTAAGQATTATGTTEKSTYTIESGDTLAAIADRLGTDVQTLLDLNPGVDPAALRVGQQIKVP